jgi:hypothetical protein
VIRRCDLDENRRLRNMWMGAIWPGKRVFWEEVWPVIEKCIRLHRSVLKLQTSSEKRLLGGES